MADDTFPGPLLDLNTLIDRPTIAIDDKLYEILSTDELSILDSQRFQKWGTEIERLAEADDSEAELNALIDKVAKHILVGVPDDVFGKLQNGHKARVIEVFTGLLLGDRIGAAGAALTGMNRSIGANSSPASSASSEAHRNGGSKTHPLPS